MPGIWPIGNVRAILNKPDDDKPGQMKAKPIVWWNFFHKLCIKKPYRMAHSGPLLNFDSLNNVNKSSP